VQRDVQLTDITSPHLKLQTISGSFIADLYVFKHTPVTVSALTAQYNHYYMQLLYVRNQTNFGICPDAESFSSQQISTAD